MAETDEEERRELHRRARIAGVLGLVAIVIGCLLFAAVMTTLRAR